MVTAKTSMISSVWHQSNYEVSTLSKRVYVFMISIWLVAGLVASALSANAMITSGYELGVWETIGLIVLTFAGAILSGYSDNSPVSLFAYILIAIPFGMLLGPLLQTYSEGVLVKTLFVTTSMVVVLGFVGTIIPQSLESWGSYLMGALLILIVGMLAVPIASYLGFPVSGALGLIDWCAVIIFSAFVVFDMNRAMRLPRTVNNTINVATAIYLDFLNLFVHLLRIMSGSND